jgi:hypothetical protein
MGIRRIMGCPRASRAAANLEDRGRGLRDVGERAHLVTRETSAGGEWRKPCRTDLAWCGKQAGRQCCKERRNKEEVRQEAGPPAGDKPYAPEGRGVG